ETDFLFGERIVDFEPVVDAIGDGAPLGDLAAVFEEAGDFTHGEPWWTCGDSRVCSGTEEARLSPHVLSSQPWSTCWRDSPATARRVIVSVCAAFFSTLLNSCGKTLTNFGSIEFQSSRILFARGLPVASK